MCAASHEVIVHRQEGNLKPAGRIPIAFVSNKAPLLLLA